VGGKAVTFVRRQSDGTTLRIGDGIALALDRDAKSVLMLDEADRTRLRLLPVGAGSARDLPRSGLSFQWAKLYPNDDRLLALASRRSQPSRRTGGAWRHPPRTVG
jgi:hypothetical protein